MGYHDTIHVETVPKIVCLVKEKSFLMLPTTLARLPPCRIPSVVNRHDCLLDDESMVASDDAFDEENQYGVVQRLVREIAWIPWIRDYLDV